MSLIEQATSRDDNQSVATNMRDEDAIILEVQECQQDQSSSQKGKKVFTTDYNLACFTLWWRRMERDGVKEKAQNDLESERQRSEIAISPFLKGPSKNTHTKLRK